MTLCANTYYKMDVALSEECNYSCIMCRRPPRSARLEADDVARVLEEAKEIGLEVVSFCGGEPFVHPDFFQIAEHALSLGLKVQLTTNGSLVTEEAVARLVGLDCLTVSIDGLAQTHDGIRGVEGAFDRAVRALTLAREAGITAGTNTVIQRGNAHDLLPLFEHLVETSGLDYVRHAPVEVLPDTTHLMVSGDLVGVVQDQLRAIATRCEELDIFFSHPKQLLHHLPLFLDKFTRHRPAGGCKIPTKFIGYSDMGFYLCWHQGKSIRAPSLAEALASDVAHAIVAEAAAGECVGCNALTYSWDEEWNDGILEGKLIADGSLATGHTEVSGDWKP